MAEQDIRKRIHQVVDEMPDEILQNILEYFQEIEQSPTEKVRLYHNFKKILSEDKALLHKLAL